MHYVKHAEFFGPLLMRGAKIDVQDHQGKTALHRNSKGDTERLKAFLQHTPDLDARDNNGETALHYVAFNQDITYLPGNARLLLAAGANPDIQNNKRQTPVHIATTTLFWEVLALLIAARADVNIRDNEGRTPLKMIEDGILPYYGEPELVYFGEDYPDDWMPGKEDIAKLLRVADGHR